MKRVSALVFSLVVIVVVLAAYVPRTLAVETIQVPGRFGDTIQAAIDNAGEGDTIVVSEGTYTENIDITSKKNLTLMSTDPDNPNVVVNTIINGGGAGSVVTFTQGTGSVLAGVTLTNGMHEQGGGILCGSCSPLITNCIISYNTALIGGGGIYCVNSSPNITKCTITENSAPNGGGISWGGTSPMQTWVTNCLITDNTASSYGGGMYFPAGLSGNITITNCTFSGNSASERNAGCGMHFAAGSAIITNCIFYGDGQKEISPGYLTATYSAVAGGYSGTGNISLDPHDPLLLLFKNQAEGDYHLISGSPCIDAGINDKVPEDIEGNTRPVDGDGDTIPKCDIGAYEFRVEEPTNLIELDEFSALSEGDQIVITWTTLSETDTAGFNLWRVQAEGGEYTRINSTMIEAMGGATLSAEYFYNDDTALPGEYYYQLEEVDNMGVSTLYGPVSAAVSVDNAIEKRSVYHESVAWWPYTRQCANDYFWYSSYMNRYLYGCNYY